MDDLKNKLEDEFGVKQLPEISAWRIQRLDICYAWKLLSNEDAHLALATMKPYELPRKNQVVYDTTIKFAGYSYSATFYLKHEEFLAKDCQELTKWGFGSFAEHITKLSEGVLRFEVSMHKPKLDTFFGKDIFYEDIMDTERMQSILRTFLTEITSTTDHSLMDLAKVSRLITNESTRRQAWDNWCFYRAHSSSNPIDREMLKLLPRATRYTKLKRLKELGVGVYDQDNNLAFAFDIPSPYEVVDTQINND